MAKVFLSAGHGGSDPGAVGNGLKEKDINLVILKACKAELEKNGITVVTSRLGDENDPVGQEVNEANASKADVAVSFHTNAGGGDGSETYYWASDKEGKRLAELCEKHVRAIGQNAHGNPIKSGNHLWFIKKTNMTAVLCECAFIDSTDKEIIDTTAEQEKFGVAYANAIMDFLGATTKKETKPKTTTTAATKNKKYKLSGNLYIRSGAGTSYSAIGVAKSGETIEVSEVKNGWGFIPARKGWISLGTKWTKAV